MPDGSFRARRPGMSHLRPSDVHGLGSKPKSPGSQALKARAKPCPGDGFGGLKARPKDSSSLSRAYKPGLLVPAGYGSVPFETTNQLDALSLTCQHYLNLSLPTHMGLQWHTRDV